MMTSALIVGSGAMRRDSDSKFAPVTFSSPLPITPRAVVYKYNGVALPRELADINAELTAVADELDKCEASFLSIYQQKEKGFYTNETLQNQVGRTHEKNKELLDKVKQKKQAIERMIELNIDIFSEEVDRQEAAILAEKHRKFIDFVLELSRYKRQVDDEYAIAKAQFDKRNAEIKQVQKIREKELLKFQKHQRAFIDIVNKGDLKKMEEFKAKIEYAKVETVSTGSKSNPKEVKFDLKPVLTPLPLEIKEPQHKLMLIPNEDALVKQEKDFDKRIEKLDQLAQATTSDFLKGYKRTIDAALADLKKNELQQLSALALKANTLKEVDKIAVGTSRQLIEELTQAVSDYQRFSQQIKLRITLERQEIGRECASLKAKIEKRTNTIKDLCVTYQALIRDRSPNETIAASLKRLEDFDTYNAQYHLHTQYGVAERTQSADYAAIQQRIKKLKAELGAEYEGDVKNSNLKQLAEVMQARINFTEVGTKFEGIVDRDVADKNNYRYGLALRRIMEVLKSAINDNVAFWHGQIDDFWGSRDKITKNRVSVPNGIMQIYELLNNPGAHLLNKAHDVGSQTEVSKAESILTQIATIAQKKKGNSDSVFVNGLFAKRKANTTGEFYKVVASLKDEILNNKFGDLKLKAIKPPGQSEYEHKIESYINEYRTKLSAITSKKGEKLNLISQSQSMVQQNTVRQQQNN